MSGPKIEDIRFSSSSIDDFFADRSPRDHVASSGRIRVSNVHNLSGFQVVAEDTLVRVSQKDFWQVGQDAEGFFIERLVSDDDGPVNG